ncbi:MAG: AI-2E family transporter [Campylobacterota bacterium]|nr:AI-2E family transporter [Campylobacterota bacterium]
MAENRSVGYFFIVAAAVIIVLAGIKTASSIIVPLLLSVFIAIILSPLFEWLKSKHLPDALALTLVITFFIGLVSLVAMLVGNSAQDFSDNLPLYTQQLEARFSGIVTNLASWGIGLPEGGLKQLFDPNVAVGYAAGMLKGMGSALTNSFVILLMVIFMLSESRDFVQKIVRMDGEAIGQFEEVADKIKHYMVLKAVISLGTGVTVSVMLMVIGVDYAFLWGVVAFLFNFIPNIGSIIAAVPVVLLAFIQLDAISAGIVAIGFLVINTLFGSVIEPKVMGKGLGISTLIVFLSLIFWGWLLGPVGMLLSIPLTIMAKIALDARPNTRWVAMLLGAAEEEKA